MYANPKLAEPILKKIRSVAVQQSKVTIYSEKWNELNAYKAELCIQWASLRMKRDPLATTYK